MPTVIGITGGIGSGKSLIANILHSLGHAVYTADDAAKKLMNNDPSVKIAIQKAFGENIYTAHGLNRKALANIVFNDPSALTKVNAIVHPAVQKDFEMWQTNLMGKYSLPFLFKEAAILYESGTVASCDGVLNVYAPIKVRLSRVMKRDKVSEAAIYARIQNQWPDVIKLKKADFTIYNDGKQLITPQIQLALQFFQRKKFLDTP